MTRLAAAILVLLATACASNSSPYNIDYDSFSSQLYVEGPDGQLIEPLEGQIVDVGDFGIGRSAIRLMPGEHRVRTVCPTGSDGVTWNHGQPGILHKFEVGKAYVLRCEDGYPVIELRE